MPVDREIGKRRKMHRKRMPVDREFGESDYEAKRDFLADISCYIMWHFKLLYCTGVNVIEKECLWLMKRSGERRKMHRKEYMPVDREKLVKG
ncbi:hypothetical protein CEXT_586931 [Caerostris extrusa]|uniref:Uncharacterized protein n=1 Tax=Caerostris extrusa TaxID=172846 RepID=A0AAV4VTN9_CAEEX|nr:hypothetical protein CEXT_586931 [Caerostris extrusa]